MEYAAHLGVLWHHMYFQDVGQHHAPRVHVRYGEYKAVFAVEIGERLAGRLGGCTRGVYAVIALLLTARKGITEGGTVVVSLPPEE